MLNLEQKEIVEITSMEYNSIKWDITECAFQVHTDDNSA